MSHRACLIITVAVVAAGTPGAATEPALVEALREAGIAPAELTIDADAINYFDPACRPLPLLRWSLRHPLQMGALADDIVTAFRPTAVLHAASGFSRLSRFSGAAVNRQPEPAALRRRWPTSRYREACRQAFRRMHQLAGVAWTPADKIRFDRQIAAVSDPLAAAAAVLLTALVDAEQLCRTDLAAQKLDESARLAWFLETFVYNQQTSFAVDPPAPRQAAYRNIHDQIDRFDHRMLCGAAQDLVYAVQVALPMIRQAAAHRQATASLDLDTPLGRVVVGNRSDDQYDRRPCLLLVDLGGNDTYAAAGQNRWPQQTVSVAIDLAGDDLYQAGAGDSHSFGAGLCGIGLLFDLAGRDVYRADKQSQGFALFGAGLLFDAAGDDQYYLQAGGQGMAVAGQALLIDLGGHDQYHLLTCGQGCGGPAAAAALIDMSGDDSYEAGGHGRRYPSQQSSGQTASYAQGCGRGMRADHRYGYGLAGGVGLLYDAAGDDRYRAEVFGQGVGYWHGLGLLVDGRGNDRYEGYQHVQAAGVHFAAGVLVDQAGDDTYRATGSYACASAHDLALGLLDDQAGNDTYQAPAFSLGASMNAAIAVLLERSGADTYVSASTENFGWCAVPRRSLRRTMPGLAIFLELGGQDAYPRAELKNNARWLANPKAPSFPQIRSVGVDISGRPAAR